MLQTAFSRLEWSIVFIDQNICRGLSFAGPFQGDSPPLTSSIWKEKGVERLKAIRSLTFKSITWYLHRNVAAKHKQITNDICNWPSKSGNKSMDAVTNGYKSSVSLARTAGWTLSSRFIIVKLSELSPLNVHGALYQTTLLPSYKLTCYFPLQSAQAPSKTSLQALAMIT